MKKILLFLGLCILSIQSVYSFDKFVNPNPTPDDGFGERIEVLANGNVVISAMRADITELDCGAVYLFNGKNGELIKAYYGTTENERLSILKVFSNQNTFCISGYYRQSPIKYVYLLKRISEIDGEKGEQLFHYEMTPDSSMKSELIYKDFQNNYFICNKIATVSGNNNAGEILYVDSKNGQIIKSFKGQSENENLGTVIFHPQLNNFFIVSPQKTVNGIKNAGEILYYNGETLELISKIEGNQENEQVEKIDFAPNGNIIHASNKRKTVNNLREAVFSIYSPAKLQKINSFLGTTSNNDYNYTYYFLKDGFLIHSKNWDDGVKPNLGALSYIDYNLGKNGTIEVTNSIIGEQTNDLSYFNFDTINNKNKILLKFPKWNNGANQEAGALMVFNLSDLNNLKGKISANNSIVGNHNKDYFAWAGKPVKFSENLYAISNSYWNENRGAITWIDLNKENIGEISAANSLLGRSKGDLISTNYFLDLYDGYYLIYNSRYKYKDTTRAGAFTVIDSKNPVTGVVDSTNSQIGSNHYDFETNDSNTNEDSNDDFYITQYGTAKFLIEYDNENYAIYRRNWNEKRGAITLFNKRIGLKGVLGSHNSLVGTNPNDKIGYNGIFALPKGSFIVASSYWANGDLKNAGAITLLKLNGFHNGEISKNNSLIGSHKGDNIGYNPKIITTLKSNIPYVVNSISVVFSNVFWNNYLGCINFCNGDTLETGEVSELNSIISVTTNNMFSNNEYIYTVSGKLIIRNSSYDNNSGIIRVFNEGEKFTGLLNSKNYIVGKPGDKIGSYTFLTNNQTLLTASSSWDNNDLINAGFMANFDINKPLPKTIDSTNAIVGRLANDSIGANIYYTSDSLFVFVNQQYSNSKYQNVGAITIWDPKTSFPTQFDTTNSLIGSSDFDRIGSGSSYWELDYNSFLAFSPSFSYNGISKCGAVTFLDLKNPLKGYVNENNSLIGSHTYDFYNSRFSRADKIIYLKSYQNNLGAIYFLNFRPKLTGFLGPETAMISGDMNDNIAKYNMNYLKKLNNDSILCFAFPQYSLNNKKNIGYFGMSTINNPITGNIGPNNGLIGTTEDDFLYSWQTGIFEVGQIDDNFFITTTTWDNIGLYNAGAVTFFNKNKMPHGEIGPSNSICGNNKILLRSYVRKDTINSNYFVTFAYQGYGWEVFVRPFDKAVKVEEMNTDIQIDNAVYPNPSNSNINVKLNIKNAGVYTTDIFAVEGKLVKSINSGYLNTGENIINLNVGDLTNGAYIIRVFSDKDYFIKKFTKE